MKALALRSAPHLAVLLVALATRLPRIHRLGATEGGGDEWYTAWRTLGVLFEGGDPGTSVHPALFYDIGAVVIGAGYALGRLTGAMDGPADLFAAFASDDAWLLCQLQYVSAFAGAITAVIVLELGARTYGRRAGVVAALLLALTPLAVECSQAVRVDSVYALFTTAAGLALHRVWTGGGMRAYAVAGALIGLAASANHPGWFLVLPLVAAHFFRARRPEDGSHAGIRRIVLALLAIVVVFVATNPMLFFATDRFVDGLRFQLAFAFESHPGREAVAPGFYVGTIARQGSFFALVAAIAVVWSLARSPGFGRGAAIFALSYFVAFSLVATQFDRYVLPVLPWLCLFVGGALHELAGKERTDPRGRVRHALAGAAMLLALYEPGVTTIAGAVSPEGSAEAPDRVALLRFVATHAERGDTVWIEADTVPYLQAAFADPGGRVAALAREGFARAFPHAAIAILKGELVERNRNYDPALLAGRVRWAVTCERTSSYVREQRADLPLARAFYEMLEREGTRVFSTGRGCHVVELR